MVSKAMMVALRDCANFPRGDYIWKPSTMRKLAEAGLVEPVSNRNNWHGDIPAYAPTAAGRAALAKES